MERGMTSGTMTRRSCLARAGALLAALGGRRLVAEAADPRDQESLLRIDRDDQAVVVKAPSGEVLLRYQLRKPSDSKLSVDSACYFHPLKTPSGLEVTEVAPEDHLHHRGIFLGWVEMHGAKAADFWGWGAHAPKDGRKIENREVGESISSREGATFRARNHWVADGETILEEQLTSSFSVRPGAHVLDLVYRLTPRADLTIAQWAFSGFCVRLRRGGLVDAFNPQGLVQLLDPQHTEPRSDWPAAAWYAFALRLEGGKTAAVAVIDHPQNPPTAWHNHRGLRMLNPCIVAPGRLLLKAGKPLHLRYRVAAADGSYSKDLVGGLAEEWQKRTFEDETSAAR